MKGKTLNKSFSKFTHQDKVRGAAQVKRKDDGLILFASEMPFKQIKKAPDF